MIETQFRWINELQRHILKVRYDRVPAVLAAIDGAPSPSTSPSAKAFVSVDTTAIVSAVDLLKQAREMERVAVMRALVESDGNLSAAARLLGFQRKTFERIVRKLGVRR